MPPAQTCPVAADRRRRGAPAPRDRGASLPFYRRHTRRRDVVPAKRAPACLAAAPPRRLRGAAANGHRAHYASTSWIFGGLSAVCPCAARVSNPTSAAREGTGSAAGNNGRGQQVLSGEPAEGPAGSTGSGLGGPPLPLRAHRGWPGESLVSLFFRRHCHGADGSVSGLTEAQRENTMFRNVVRRPRRMTRQHRR